MANFLQEHWYLKDLQYFYRQDGWMIVATTDVPCHLFCRMTTTPPRKHALPSYRRGLALQGDIRFCFVVYEDNEQDEPGDTLTHTWLKSAWPIGETRWFYFIGSIASKSSVSETPIFKFHYPAPPPEPPPLPFFVSLDHLPLRVPGESAWVDLQWDDGTPLRDHLPPDTKVLYLHAVSTGANEYLGLRQKGSTWTEKSFVFATSHRWAHVGVNPNIECEIYVTNVLTQPVYLEGYSRSTSTLTFVNPYDKTPVISGAWITIDLSIECPNATGILAEIVQPGGWSVGIRKNGSTDNRTTAGHHFWTIIGCDHNQRIQFFPGIVPGPVANLYIWGYIVHSAYLYTNADNITPAVLGAYQTIPGMPPSTFSFIEVTSTAAGTKYALRKNGLPHDIYRGIDAQHCFAFVALNSLSVLQAKIQHFALSLHLSGRGY